MVNQRVGYKWTLIGICAVLAIVAYYTYTTYGRETHPFAMIPRKYHSSHEKFRCEELFSAGTPAEKFQMSPAYMRHKDEFLAEAAKYNVDEGHTNQIELQYRALHYLASSSNVRTICETGFNAGHSSFNWLTANDKVIVYSFDIGRHDYTRSMVKYFMTSTFKDRITVIFGDSVKTIPKFFAENPGVRCDIISVDGGHTYEVAINDLRNFIPMASERNLIIADDYPITSSLGLAIGKAWNETIKSGKIKELMKCSTANGKRGFSVGTVV